MKPKKTKVKSRSVGKPPTSLFLSLLRAAVISLGCGLALLLLLCAILLGTDDPCAYAQTAAALIPVPISVICGILAAKNNALGGLPSGLLGGAMLCAMLFVLGAVLPHSTVAALPTVLNTPLRAAACLLLSAVGGYCVTHKKPKTHRRHP